MSPSASLQIKGLATKYITKKGLLRQKKFSEVVVFFKIIIHQGCHMELSKNILCALCINQFDASNWKKRQSQFHQQKEISTQRWTITLIFIIHKIVLIINSLIEVLLKNFSYKVMVWKILFQTNLMVTVTVWNKYLDRDIFLNLLSSISHLKVILS